MLVIHLTCFSNCEFLDNLLAVHALSGIGNILLVEREEAEYEEENLLVGYFTVQ
jgi:hypothetical protein